MAGLRRRTSHRQELIAVDLGSKTTKAVHLRRVGDEYHLLGYVLVDAPPPERAFARNSWAEHLRKVVRVLGASTRRLVVAVGTSQSILANVELPFASVSDLRRMVKLSPKTYLQQELPDHLFDCYRPGTADAPGDDRLRRKTRALVAGARRSLVEDLVDGARDAGLTLEEVGLAPVAAANAFQMSLRAPTAEAFALLDIGFRSSTISILHQGSLALTRVVNVGAEKLAALLEQTNPEPGDEVTDDEPAGLSDALQSALQKAISGLAREVDASIGFFQSQHDATVSLVHVSGGSARSHFILQTIEMELGLPCRSWNPAGTLLYKPTGGPSGELEYEAPQLAVAVGVGLGRLKPDLIRLNLLAQPQEDAEWRRRDPVRRTRLLVAGAVVLMAAWAGGLGLEIWIADRDYTRVENERLTLERSASVKVGNLDLPTRLERQELALERHGAQRFLMADVLNALQFVTVDKVQFHRLGLERQVRRTEPARARPARARTGAAPRPKPEAPTVHESFVLRIQGKTYGDTRDIDRLVDRLAAHPFFQERLRPERPIELVSVMASQVDPAEPDRSFRMFTIECHFLERVFTNDTPR